MSEDNGPKPAGGRKPRRRRAPAAQHSPSNGSEAVQAAVQAAGETASASPPADGAGMDFATFPAAPEPAPVEPRRADPIPAAADADAGDDAADEAGDDEGSANGSAPSEPGAAPSGGGPPFAEGSGEGRGRRRRRRRRRGGGMGVPGQGYAPQPLPPHPQQVHPAQRAQQAQQSSQPASAPMPPRHPQQQGGPRPEVVNCEGVLELRQDGLGCLRSIKHDFSVRREDPLVPQPMTQRFGLRAGSHVVGRGLKFPGNPTPRLDFIETIDGQAPGSESLSDGKILEIPLCHVDQRPCNVPGRGMAIQPAGSTPAPNSRCRTRTAGQIGAS